MSQEFFHIADRFNAILRDRGPRKQDGIRVSELPQIISNIINDEINCYPSDHHTDCKNLAVFFSFTDSSLKKGNGHINFRQALHHLVNHFQGHCPNGKSRGGIIFTDNFDYGALNFWRSNLLQKV